MENKLEWDSVIPLKNVGSIDEFERKVGFKFPQSFRELVIANNAGYPNKAVFDTDIVAEGCIQNLYSFNREDEINIFDFYDWGAEDFEELGWKYIEFASSDGGDPIAFDPRTGHIIYIDHETLNVKQVAETFDEFLEKLYELDYDFSAYEPSSSQQISSVPPSPTNVQEPHHQHTSKPKKRGFSLFFWKK